jgi:signal transduction histidine kinase
MTKKFTLVFLFFILISSAKLTAQTSIKDSLLKIATANQLDSPTVSAFLNLGNLYKQEQDSTKSADYYFKALNLAKKIDFRRGIMVSLTEIGYLAEVTEDLPKAKAYYTSAIQYGKKNNLKRQVALAYSYMFFIYSSRSEFNNAIIYADSSLKIFEQLGRKKDVANQLNNIGTSYWKLHKNVEAIKYLQRTLDILDDIGTNAEFNKLNTCLNIGLVFEDLKSHDQALKYFNKVIPIALKYNATKNLNDAYNNIGNVYLNTKNYSKALYHYKLSLPFAIKSDQAQAIGICYANIATCLTNLKRYQEAEKYFKLSNKEYQSIGNKEGLAINMVNSAQLLAETKKLNQAEVVLKNAMDIANKNNFTVIKQSIFESMAEVSKLKGEFTEAYMKQDSALQLQNKNFNFDTNKQIADLEVKYKTTQKEKQILAAKSELLIADASIQKRNLGLTIALSLVLILGVSAFFISRNAKLKQQKIKEEAALQLILSTAETKNQVQEEKLRISQELHDNIGAQLSFINSSIGTMFSNDKENVQLQETQTITQNTIRELRSTVWLINQQEFSLDEFVVKLRDYVKPYHTGKPHITIEDLSEGNIVLQPIVATNLFRVIQEVVNNAIKHADASALNISFKSNSQELELLISDNGKGFDLNLKANGYGLKNINSRIQNIKGKHQFLSKNGEGTKVTINIPL